MMVIDASAVLELLLQRPAANQVAERFDGIKIVCAPHLLDLEVTQVLRRYQLGDRLTAERGREALYDFRELGIVLYPHSRLLERIWELRNDMTAYDAAYVALAELLSIPLLTCDAKLAKAVGDRVAVAVIEGNV